MGEKLCRKVKNIKYIHFCRNGNINEYNIINVNIYLEYFTSLSIFVRIFTYLSVYVGILMDIYNTLVT